MGGWRYSCYSFWASTLDGVSGQRYALAALYPWGKTHVTRWIGDWVGLEDGLSTKARWKIIYLYRGSSPARPVWRQNLKCDRKFLSKFIIVIFFVMNVKSQINSLTNMAIVVDTIHCLGLPRAQRFGNSNCFRHHVSVDWVYILLRVSS
jgi:hypothetical protein